MKANVMTPMTKVTPMTELVRGKVLRTCLRPLNCASTTSWRLYTSMWLDLISGRGHGQWSSSSQLCSVKMFYCSFTQDDLFNRIVDINGEVTKLSI